MTIPQHLAIIIDGNRRWALANGKSKLEGHSHGIETLKKLVPVLIDRAVPVVSIFTFSTENWKRTEEEVSVLMNLIVKAFRDHFSWLTDQGVRVQISGRMSDFSPKIQDVFKEAVENSKENTKLITNFCLSYGGREEILQMTKRIAAEVKGDPEAIEKLDDAAIEKNLYTAGLPDVDLVIRTGGERRLSGFLPWQTVYAELYFTDTFWPDFTEQKLDAALEDFATRKRNFGK